jgi:hypothetical protein
MAVKELKLGHDCYNVHNYKNATEHFMKSLLFNYDENIHE